MHAAILHHAGQPPQVGDFEEPPSDDDVVDVRVAGCNPVDLLLASGAMGDPVVPSIVGQEGVGTTGDGRRVYFNSPPTPFGSWAERTKIDPGRTFPVPDGLDDELAVALGIAGLAAWLPLTRHASVQGGRSVLVLGATGIVGRIAVQAAKLLGAGTVVAAGRDREALEEVAELGADATVVLGQGDDEAALRRDAGGGYEVVIDTVYGEPFLAALATSAAQATLVTVGLGAGPSPAIPFSSLQGRTHIGHGNNVLSPEVLRVAYGELAAHATNGHITVPTRTYPLAEAAEAWEAQRRGPHIKLAVVPSAGAAQ